MLSPIAILVLSPLVAAATLPLSLSQDSEISPTNTALSGSETQYQVEKIIMHDSGLNSGANLAHDGGNSENAGLANATSGASRSLPMPLISLVVVLGLL